MSKNKFNSLSALVFSTDPDFKPYEEQQEQVDTLPPSNQLLKVRLETKHRAGKAVTLITGFEGSVTDIEELCKKLKTFCGTGGSVKDGEMIVQGDHRDKVMVWLGKNGYVKAKRV
ncbi:MAG: translation initiation factor [Chitinophagaceae bacterium]